MPEEGSSTLSYFARWYKKNKESVLAERRRKYHEDPEYREKVMAQARESKKRRQEKNRVEREKNKHKEKPLWFKIPYGRQEIPVRMFTAGQLAKRLGRKTQTIRMWERGEVIPEAIYRSRARDRLYTELQVREIVEIYSECVRRHGARKMWTRIGSTEFSDRVHKLWEDYPLGIDEEEL